MVYKYNNDLYIDFYNYYADFNDYHFSKDFYLGGYLHLEFERLEEIIKSFFMNIDSSSSLMQEVISKLNPPYAPYLVPSSIDVDIEEDDEIENLEVEAIREGEIQISRIISSKIIERILEEKPTLAEDIFKLLDIQDVDADETKKMLKEIDNLRIKLDSINEFTEKEDYANARKAWFDAKAKLLEKIDNVFGQNEKWNKNWENIKESMKEKYELAYIKDWDNAKEAERKGTVR